MIELTEAVSYKVTESIGIISINSPPVNALGHPVRKGILIGIEQAIKDDQIKAIIIICRGRTFCAGADIREFGKPPIEPVLIKVLPEVDACPKPVIAAIHGTALGGGLELALSCNFRVAVESAKLGLPESKLGLLPGAGGTQRLPRVVGVEKALDMIVYGNPVSANEAFEIGLIDLIIDKDLETGAIDFTNKILAENLPVPRISENNEKILPYRGNTQIFDAFRKKIAKKTRGFLAPESIIKAIEGAVSMDFDQGVKYERELFQGLMNDSQSSAQRYFFFAERKVAKIPDLPKDTPQIDINSMGIIGAGTMGVGIVIAFLDSGMPVTLVEQKQDFLDKGVDKIQKHYQNQVAKKRMTQKTADERINRLTGSLSMNDLSDVDMVIEVVFEDIDLKKSIFTQLDSICKEGAILASNTSFLNVNEIAACTQRPEYVIGLHFFNPANIMKSLEIVRGDKTSKSVLATAVTISKRIGKIAVVVGVCYGFAGNRMFVKRSREVGKLILEGATADQIDRVIYNFGFPMGPFVLGDLVGLDVGWKKETSTGTTLKDKLCELERYGIKSGKGYYKYEKGSHRPIPDPTLNEIIEDVAQEQKIIRRTVSDKEIEDRCIYALINEGAKIVEEGIAIRPSDIDVLYVYGYGWPKYRGGPMFYADLIGLENVTSTLKEFESKYGNEWKPAPLLEKLVREGKNLDDLN